MATKNIFKYAAYILIAISISACNEGIDEIKRVDPGPDLEAPVVKINNPMNGLVLQVKEDIASLNIEIEASDDIELGDISVKVDGKHVKTFTGADYIDYRKMKGVFRYDGLDNGAHTVEVTASDLSGKTTTVISNFEKKEAYKAKYANEVFYANFDADHVEMIEVAPFDKIGYPGFTEGKKGRAYKGAVGAYLKTSVAVDQITASKEFTAVFWYKLNTTPDRAGILVIAADDPIDADNDNKAKDPSKKNLSKYGFRFLREGSATNQKLNLNVGNGTGDTWINSIELNTTTHSDWQHIAFTISETECTLYLNGEVVKQAPFSGIDWKNCQTISIGSGAPYFTVWNHLSDASAIDELRMFNKALTKKQIQEVMIDE